MNDSEPLEKRVERLEEELGQVRAELGQILAETRRNGEAAEHHAAKAASPGAERAVRESGPVSTTSTGYPQTPTGAENGRSRNGRLFSGSHSPEASSNGRLPLSSRLGLDGLGDLRSGEWWLARLGIGLVLFGVVLLFGYSVQRGWLTPAVQVGIGLGVGLALIALGLYVYEDRRHFSRVLLGGGVGALYITGFAAFQVYSLVPQVLAFGFMVAVTLLSCALSLRQDEASLSVIGALGGLGTPFLLYTGAGSVTGLVIYICLILSGTAAVYLYKNWTSLLAVSFVGGWLALATGYAFGLSAEVPYDTGVNQHNLALQLGVAFSWLLFWLVPLARESLSDSGLMSLRRRSRHTVRGVVHAYVALSPLIALGLTAAIWLPGPREMGWITLGGTVLYALAAYGLHRLIESGISRTHALVALLLFTIALPLLLRGEVLYLALAAESAFLHLVARRFSDRLVSVAAHLLSCVVLIWLILRLPPFATGSLWGLTSWPLGLALLVDLVVIGLAVAASMVMPSPNPRKVYRLVAHVALLLLMWRALSTLPGGDGWVTVAWATYAAGIFVAGLRLDRTLLVRVGLGTLFAVVGKLFVVDLASIDAFWRVLLFLGAGVLFLALSYYLRSLWQPGAESKRRV